VDGHPRIGRGVAELAAVESDRKVIAEAGNGREAIEQFRLHRPDITLMDLHAADERTGCDHRDPRRVS
jgi:DNA-binding NarL/FixJ family response regulator